MAVCSAAPCASVCVSVALFYCCCCVLPLSPLGASFSSNDVALLLLILSIRCSASFLPEMPLFSFSKPDPVQQAREWKRHLTQQGRLIEREIRGAQASPRRTSHSYSLSGGLAAVTATNRHRARRDQGQAKHQAGCQTRRYAVGQDYGARVAYEPQAQGTPVPDARSPKLGCDAVAIEHWHVCCCYFLLLLFFSCSD